MYYVIKLIPQDEPWKNYFIGVDDFDGMVTISCDLNGAKFFNGPMRAKEFFEKNKKFIKMFRLKIFSYEIHEVYLKTVFSEELL